MCVQALGAWATWLGPQDPPEAPWAPETLGAPTFQDLDTLVTIATLDTEPAALGTGRYLVGLNGR